MSSSSSSQSCNVLVATAASTGANAHAIMKAKLINLLIAEELIVSQDRLHDIAFARGMQATILLVRFLIEHNLPFRTVYGYRQCCGTAPIDEARAKHVWVETDSIGILDHVYNRNNINTIGSRSNGIHINYDCHNTTGTGTW